MKSSSSSRLKAYWPRNSNRVLLYSYDLELRETTKQIVDAVERVKPSRVVLDSLSEIRLMAQSSLRYRRHLLSIKHYFARYGATVILLDDLTAEAGDKTAHSIAHGVIQLEELAPIYGAERRRMRILKYRGQKYRGGYHDFTITTGGINVFPRLVAAEHRTTFTRTQRSTGISNFDVLLGGGIDSWFQHLDPRSRRHRKIVDSYNLRNGRGCSRREGCVVHIRRRPRIALRSDEGFGD